MSKVFQRWGCALLLGMTGPLGLTQAQAQPQLYASGQFPAGRVYTETDLDALDGRLLQTPSYLIGKFIYLGESHGACVFSTFALSEKTPHKITFGKVLILVR